jgi:ABC-2 type transport system permease protein
MIFTKNIFQVIKRELYYQWFSKKILLLFIILLFFSIAHLVGLYNDTMSNYNRYLMTEDYYKEQGIDIVEALKEPISSQVDGNSRIVNNPIKDDFVELVV